MSALGKVKDAPGGSYYFDSLTDALAREAWKRFQGIEREGGIEKALVGGGLRARIESAWSEWLGRLSTRKTRAGCPQPASRSSPASMSDSRVQRRSGPLHRVPRRFRCIATPSFSRSCACGRMRSPPDRRPFWVALGPLAESRARVGFASNFFSAGGIRTREVSRPETAAIACLCGSDERYAAEGVDQARASKAAGCRRILLAGRPGALEAAASRSLASTGSSTPAATPSPTPLRAPGRTFQ